MNHVISQNFGSRACKVKRDILRTMHMTYKLYIPRRNNVVSTSMRRNDVASTLIRCCFHVVVFCLLWCLSVCTHKQYNSSLRMTAKWCLVDVFHRRRKCVILSHMSSGAISKHKGISFDLNNASIDFKYCSLFF